jgi:hypothetical protein
MSTATAANPKTQHVSKSSRRRLRLGNYTASDTGDRRQIVSLARPDGSTLVVDYLAVGLIDGRLVVHLPADEPPENARLVCDLYLADATRGACRRLTAEDLERTRHIEPEPAKNSAADPPPPLRDADGYLYRICEVPTDTSVPTLRWTRSCNPGCEEPFEVVTLRSVIGRLQDYEQARTITFDALVAHEHNPGVSVCVLRDQLNRVDCSVTVLNRGLREATQRAVGRGVSRSEIAMRCGRIKRDKRGNRSGETSWLARRLGELPEAGMKEPTSWVHTDVLALIARKGLNIAPREIEL